MGQVAVAVTAGGVVSCARARRWSDERETDRGVDPGRYGDGIVARTAEDAEVVRERVDNDATAIDELVTRVVGFAGGAGQALWVIKADSGDGAVLTGELLARGELVATLTPTEVAVRRKGRRQAHKSDLIDAEVCARIGREEPLVRGIG